MDINYYVFSGTGNTLLVAREVAAELTRKGCRVTLRRMEEGAPAAVAADHVVGLAFPIAFFSSYPLVLDFIEKLPRGAGQQLFVTASMGILHGTSARARPQFGLLLMLVLLPLQTLSGSTTPRESMPYAVQLLMLPAPNTHFVMIARRSSTAAPAWRWS